MSVARLVLYGAGGLGREIALLVRAINRSQHAWDLLGFIDDTAAVGGQQLGVPILGGLDELRALAADAPLSVAITIGTSRALAAVSANIAAAQIAVDFPNLGHPDASIDWDWISAGHGNIVCAGARVANARFGSFNIINMNTVLGHDVVIGDRNLISPSATLNGEVVLGSDVTIGAGATLMPRIEVGDGATVALGAVVGRSVAAGDVVAGNPARVVRRVADPSSEDSEGG